MSAKLDFAGLSVLRALVCIVACALGAGIQPGYAAIELGPVKHFDIVPQQLPSALLQFSEQSGVQITSPGQLVEGKRSPGVIGTFSPGTALALLLKDTALEFDVVDTKTVVITGGVTPASRPKVTYSELRRVSDASAPEAAPLLQGRELRLAQATPGAPSTGIAQPQTAATAGPNEGAPLDEVIVTGSSIKRINAETALPVEVLRRDDIARTGATNTEELFRQISAASSAGATVAAQGTGNLTGGISTISLRGLGSSRTLVLINGQRAAVYGGGSIGVAGNSVDISSIPIAAIERVEILRDGASAVYGSDAIAGVVNFILRSNFRGLDVTGTAGTPTRKGGGQQENVSLYGGLGDLVNDRYNAGIGVNFQHFAPLMGAARAFATRYSPGYGNDVTSSFAFPANVAIPAARGGGTRNPMVPNCGPDSLADVNFPTQCRFDNSPFDSLQPEMNKVSFMLNGHAALTSTSQLYTDDSFSQVRTRTTVQPVPLSYQNPLLAGNPYIAYLRNLLATQYPTYNNKAVAPGTGAFLLPPTSPYYPAAWAAANNVGGQPLNLIYRDFANGLRNTLDTANTVRLVGGVKGDSGGWDYDASLLYSQIQVTENLESGYPLYSKIMPLLDQGNINPFGPTSDPNALAAAQDAVFRGQDFKSKTSVTSLNGRISRELVQLPAGPLAAAAGGELRRETFEYDPAQAVQTGDIAGQGGNQLPESATRSVESAYLEFDATLLKGLELDVAGRYDHYQGIGSTANPKVSLRWQPEEWVLLRAAAGKGFRAPSLTDLYASQATSVTANGTRDWIQCPTFNASNPACSFQFTTVTGGNPNLTPEKSQSFTLGAVLEPLRDFSIELDSFWIYLKNAIAVGGLSYATIMQNAASEQQFAGYINRDAAGNIVSINQTNANLFKVNVSGLDMDLKYRFDMGSAGRLTALGNGTYFYRYVSQNADGSWTSQVDRGLNTAGGVIARFRYNATLVYELADWGASVTENYQKRFHDSAANISGQTRFVAAYETIDSQLFYQGLKDFKLTLGVRNLFNRNPPYANYASSANNFVGGYDLSYGDPLGRFVYLTAQYTLH
ncbi:MAG TPA: TonB-dependent receptor [Steroidobacteraceae bacterium]